MLRDSTAIFSKLNSSAGTSDSDFRDQYVFVRDAESRLRAENNRESDRLRQSIENLQLLVTTKLDAMDTKISSIEKDAIIFKAGGLVIVILLCANNSKIVELITFISQFFKLGFT